MPSASTRTSDSPGTAARLGLLARHAGREVRERRTARIVRRLVRRAAAAVSRSASAPDRPLDDCRCSGSHDRCEHVLDDGHLIPEHDGRPQLQAALVAE